MPGTDRLERLVNLVAALIDTRQPLTRADLRERIDGYSDDDDAFRRNFERDKELLRGMGFPLVTEAVDPNHPDEVGYRIPRELYELPDPGLDDSELAALRLALSAVCVQGDWGQDAVTQALRKLGGAAGPLAGRRAVAAIPGEDAAAAAYGAVAERRRVSFSYSGTKRLVEPWRLSFHRGHWYLAGLDRTRGLDGEERLFRLDRVEGALVGEGPAGAFERPGGAQAVPAPAWRLGDDDEVTARLLVDADQAPWALEALGPEGATATIRPDGSVEVEVSVTNRDAFRSFVLGFLDHAEIVGPPELRDDMVRWLDGLASPAPRPPGGGSGTGRSAGKAR